MAVRTVASVLAVAALIAWFFSPHWLFAVAALIALALSGFIIPAALVGLLLDLLWGAPPYAHWLPFPFTIGALAVSFLVLIVSNYVRAGSKAEYL